MVPEASAVKPPKFARFSAMLNDPAVAMGEADGWSTIMPFTINVNNDTTGTNYGTQTSGLTAGTYTITITDANSCSTTETISLNEPDPIAFDLSKVDITCNNPGGSSLGSITVENVSGGTTPFTYFISNTSSSKKRCYHSFS